ncbi:MAG: LysR family transcriptional regulator [Solimonas sp.]
MDPTLLPALAAFAQVAAAGSFTRAAALMGVSPSALSQSVRALEKKLDARLLHRTTRSVSATEEGRRLLELAGPGLQMVEQALDALDEGRGQPAGEIRINTSRMAARWLLEPHLREFHDRYPGVRLELVMDDGLGNIVGEGSDAGIRLGESLSPGMVAVPISPLLRMAVVGSPDYFARHPAPETPAELDGHDCVRFRHAGSGGIYHWEFTEPGPPPRDFSIEPRGRFTTNDDDAMLRAALRGVGLVQHVEPMVRPHVASGELREALVPWCPPFSGFHLYLPSRAQMPVKMRVLINFLLEKRDTIIPV